MINKAFAQNLHLLCSYYPTIADVCRRLDLNRSQFNKYLCGNCQPSRYTLRKICDFFGVEEHEIFLPHPQFAQIIRVRPKTANKTLQRPYVAHIDQLQKLSLGRVDKYLGYYFEYYYSMSFPGRILRGLVHIVNDGEGVYYKRVERLRFADRDGSGSRCKYLGMAFFLSERIFLIDHEVLTGSEITQTILYPTYKSRVAYLSGLKIGVSASDRHEPACARVVMEALGQNVSVKQALRLCGLFAPDCGEINPLIQERISNLTRQGDSHFLAMPQ